MFEFLSLFGANKLYRYLSRLLDLRWNSHTSITTDAILKNLELCMQLARVANCLRIHEIIIFGVYFPSCAACATREINAKITLEWAHKQFVTRVFTLFDFLHDITLNDVKNDDLHAFPPCRTRPVYDLLMTSWSIADDVTMSRQL